MCLASSQSLNLLVFDDDLHQRKSKFTLALFLISVEGYGLLGNEEPIC